ncbi:MAG: DUF2142 domain-containing protein [Cryobacterium sp.]|nr:DUF2142 domain-containing protein [Cryobacterium sp.]
MRTTTRLRVFLVSWLAFSALSAAFAVANPIGASPDEPSHIVKAASVVRGELFGTATPEGNQVQVPRYIQHSHQVCFAFQPNVTADCLAAVPEPTDELVVALTQSGFYNPLYYALVGWPSLIFDDSTGIYAMRIVSAMLTSALLALAVTTVSTWRRPLLPLLAVAVATTPMVLFLSGSVNPNGLEIAGALAAFVGLLSLVRQPETSLRTERVAIIVVAAALSANTRAVAPTWIVVAVAIALLAAGSRERIMGILRHRAVIIGLTVSILAVLVAAVWTLVAARIDATDGVDDYREFPGTGASAIVGFMRTLAMTVDFGTGAVGIFGWLDTPLPHSVYFIWAVLIGGLVLVALLTLRGRALVVAGSLVGAYVLLPAVLQGLYVTGGGYIWQGRYALPLLAIMVVGLAALLAEMLPSPSRTLAVRITVVVLLAWSAGQGYAFLVNLKRYSAGVDGGWGVMLSSDSWQAPGGNLLWLGIFAIMVLSSAVALSWWGLRLYGISETSKSAEQTALRESRS